MSEPTKVPANPAAPKKRVVRRKKKQLSSKQKLVKDSAEQRFKIEKLVFVWQEKLFSQPKTTPQILRTAATYLQPRTYSEVIEERAVQEWCGYPLCDETPKTNELQKYKISISQRKVLDQTELSNYCSEDCFKKSKYYNMQLSEEPVWFRDLSLNSECHVIHKEEEFLSAIQQHRQNARSEKTTQDLRQEYVQKLLEKVPKDTQDKFQIIEKTTEAPPVVPVKGIHDSIEGYQIEIKKEANRPTTLVLKKKEEKPAQREESSAPKERVEEPSLDLEDPDALFETMMMLKDMDLDKVDQVPEVKTLEVKKPTKTVTFAETSSPKKPPSSSSTLSSSVVEKEQKEANVINVTTQQPKKTPKKKKKNVPELSLFGTIWTMLDHMTTKATRLYLNELQNSKQRIDVSYLLAENGLKDENMYLRGQIFSERILDTYSVIRAQLDIKENLEDDIVNVIKTFKLTDASMIALDPAECYMMSLVILKSLGDILLSGSEWKLQFDECCKSVNQSTDMVDACVRVLKVASV